MRRSSVWTGAAGWDRIGLSRVPWGHSLGKGRGGDLKPREGLRGAPMAHVFISYSRKDVEFVRKLHDALREHHRDTWIDWKDIPPTAEWLAEVRSAIEAAQTFVFVISADSVTSEICKDEIAHAVKLNKRLIPIVRRDVDAKALPEALARLNWIFCRDSDDFHSACQALIKAIDTDLAWVHVHTRLLVRAIEWESKGREKSFVLRGNDLREAENWLVQSGAQEPKPTSLHTQYIIASRKEETTRKNRLLLGVTLSLMVAITLALVAFYQRQQKERQRQVAEQRYQIALARQLTTQSFILRQDQFDLALLLSIEANRIIDSLAERGTAVAEIRDSEIKSSLLAGLEFSPRLLTYLRGHTSTVGSVAFSPDGRTLASSSLDGTIKLWDVTKHQPLGPPLLEQATEVKRVIFSRDGRLLAAAICGDPHPTYGGVCRGEIRLWDATTRQPHGPPLIRQAWNVDSIAFSYSGRILASGGGPWDNTIILWDVESGQPIDLSLPGHSRSVVSLAFSPDDRLLVSSSVDGRIILWDVESGSVRWQSIASPAQPIWSVAFSPDGTKFASGSADGTVTLWDDVTRQPRGQQLTGRHRGEVRSVAFTPDSRTLASGSRDKTILLWDVSSRQPIGEPLIGHSQDILSIAMSADGRTLASAGVDTTLILWNIAEAQPLGQRLTGHRASVESVAFSHDSRMLASGSQDGTILFWDVGTHQSIGQSLTDHTSTVLRVAFSPDTTKLASGSADGSVILWDVATRQLLETSSILPTGGSMSMAFSAKAEKLASGGADGTIMLWDVMNRRPIDRRLTGHKASVESIAFSPAGQFLASGGKDGIILWDIATGQLIDTLYPLFKGSVLDLAFSHDGQTLASLVPGGMIFWDRVTRRPIGPPLTAHGPLASDIAFSPDGKRFASGSLQKPGNKHPTILLWDLATRQPIGPPLVGHTDSIKSLAFSPNGKLLASGSEDATVILWDVSAESWKIRACTIANRNLTFTEWERYLGDEPYKTTCPASLAKHNRTTPF